MYKGNSLPWVKVVSFHYSVTQIGRRQWKSENKGGDKSGNGYKNVQVHAEVKVRPALKRKLEDQF